MIPSNIGRQHPDRPSEKELRKKLEEAKMLIRQDRWSPASPGKLAANFSEIEEKLNIDATLSEDHKALLLAALDEIKVADYAGEHPPQKSYEPATKNVDMFAFCWQSSYFSERMYFKFCLVGADKGRRAFIFSIHPSTDN
ncbi:MAG TPA: hypothetical protein VG649_01395 [Candidatus Angelobacter sp.]|nr:hypothetical protein [Candidatus Angelobacter sp.]